MGAKAQPIGSAVGGSSQIHEKKFHMKHPYNRNIAETILIVQIIYLIALGLVFLFALIK